MTNRQMKRVVVTGLGSITPLGNNLQEYWEGLLQGRNGIGKITLFDASNHGHDGWDYEFEIRLQSSNLFL